MSRHQRTSHSQEVDDEAEDAPRSSVSKRYRLEQDAEAEHGRGFLSRLLAGTLGVVVVVGASLGAAWPQVDAVWTATIADVDFPAWQAYGVMICLLGFGALVLGAIAAAHDRSLWRCLLIGAAWAALVQIGISYHAAFSPEPNLASADNVTVGAVMTGTGLAPLAATAKQVEAERDAAMQAAAAHADALAAIEAQRDEAIGQRDAAQAEAAAAADSSAALRETMAEQRTRLEGQLAAAAERLATAEAGAAALEAEGEKLRQGLEATQADLEAATALAAEATTAKARLEAQLSAAEAKAQAAVRALETARTDAAARSVLGSGSSAE